MTFGKPNETESEETVSYEVTQVISRDTLVYNKDENGVIVIDMDESESVGTPTFTVYIEGGKICKVLDVIAYTLSPLKDE